MSDNIVSHDGYRMYGKIIKQLVEYGTSNYYTVGVNVPITWTAADPFHKDFRESIPLIVVENFSTFEENIFLGDIVGVDKYGRYEYGALSHINLRFLCFGMNNFQTQQLIGVVRRMMGKKNIMYFQENFGVNDIMALYGAPFPVDDDFLLSYSITAQKQRPFATYITYKVSVMYIEDMYDDYEGSIPSDEGHSYIQEILINQTHDTGEANVTVGLNATDLLIMKTMFKEFGDKL